MSNKIKHLELISNTIERMGQNSFQIKGWAVVVTAAILGLALDRSKQVSALFAFAPLAAFWLLDSYYLGLERRYRHLYDIARGRQDAEIDFDMRPPRWDGETNGYVAAAFSKTILLTYGGLAILVTVITIML